MTRERAGFRNRGGDPMETVKYSHPEERSVTSCGLNEELGSRAAESALGFSTSETSFRSSDWTAANETTVPHPNRWDS